MTPTEKELREVTAIVNTIKPLLAGRSPAVQGAVMADLLAMWLAGHAPVLREEVFTFHLGMVRNLVTVNEKLLFGDRGHPGKDVKR